MNVSNDDDYDLLNNFAHDLKSPLSAAKSFIEFIETAGELNEQQRHFSQRALMAVGRMQRIIDVLLEYARLERGTNMLIMDTCDLVVIVESIVGIMESLAAEKQVKIQIDIPPSAQFVRADPRLIDHVLSNLITNAIKYNRVGGEVFIKAQEAGSFVRVDVRDTGLGIPQKDQDRVWDRFYRVERSSNQKIDGTGLGLAIVKTVVERHNGQVRLQSDEGKGTTITFTIPKADSSASDHSGDSRETPDPIDDEGQQDRDRPQDPSVPM